MDRVSVMRMERLRFGPQDGFTPHDERLENVTISPLTAPGTAQAAIFRLGPGGRIARHPAAVAQVLAVLDGGGLVSGGDGEFHPIGPGDAVYWAAGEEHETVSDHGLTALIVEAAGLRPLG
jgi:quercetin dioxygenase-like cupin family protein